MIGRKYLRITSEEFTLPEGPEIRRAADAVGAALVGHEAISVEFAFDRLRRYQKGLSGRRIARVESRGKAILIHFDGGWAIYSHNQL